MKRIIIILFLLATISYIYALETKKVAILEVVDKENKLSNYQKLMLRSQLADEINKSVGYEAYDRTNIDLILSEHDFQRTGLVSEDQIQRLGEMTGAAYILVTEGAISYSGSLFVSTTILDVVTGKKVVTANENMDSTDKGIQIGCASLAKELSIMLEMSSRTDINAEIAEKAKYYVYEDKKGYIYNGHSLDKRAYANFLKKNCPKAYEEYNKGVKLKNAGWVCLGTGLALMAVGATHRLYLHVQQKKAYELYEESYWDDDTYNHKVVDKVDEYSKVSYALMGIGAAVTITSVPLLCIGKTKQKRSVSIYNEQCSSPSISPITFNLTAGQNGLGVAMNF